MSPTPLSFSSLCPSFCQPACLPACLVPNPGHQPSQGGDPLQRVFSASHPHPRSPGRSSPRTCPWASNRCPARAARGLRLGGGGDCGAAGEDRTRSGLGREWRELLRAAGRGAGRRGPGRAPRAHASAHSTRVLAPARAPWTSSHACTLTRELGVHLRERRPVFPSSSRETQAPAPPRSPGASRCPASRLRWLPGLQGPTTGPGCHSDAGSHSHPHPRKHQRGKGRGQLSYPSVSVGVA